MSEPTHLHCARREAATDQDQQVVLAPLDVLRAGRCGTVRSVEADDEDGDRLKALGLCEGRRVMLVQRGDPLILRVVGSRLGLSRRLAKLVVVEACLDDFCQGAPT